MTHRYRSRARLRDAMLDQEERLYDLRAALAASTVMASAPDGIEIDDMPGLWFVARDARDLSDFLHRSWRDTLELLGPPRSPAGA